MRGRCVRCGRRDRADDTFLCLDCRNDDGTFQEIDQAHRAVRASMPDDDGRNQRRYLVGVHHWAGGWPRVR